MTTRQKALIESAELAVSAARENLRDVGQIDVAVHAVVRPIIAELELACDLLLEAGGVR